MRSMVQQSAMYALAGLMVGTFGNARWLGRTHPHLAEGMHRPVAESPAERARRLHDESLIVLAHDHNFRIEDFVDMRAGGVTAKVLKLTTDGLDWNRSTASRYTVPRDPAWAWPNRFRTYVQY